MSEIRRSETSGTSLKYGDGRQSEQDRRHDREINYKRLCTNMNERANILKSSKESVLHYCNTIVVQAKKTVVAI